MKICFAGDLLIKHEYKSKLVDNELKKIFEESDIVCVNLEGPLFESAESENIKRGPHVANDISVLNALDDIGVNLVTLANNHIMDYGEKGLRITLDKLDSSNISYVGAGFDRDNIYDYIVYTLGSTSKLAIVNVGQREFGCSTNGIKPGYAWFDSECTEPMIKKAIDECDCVIVVAHMGVEDWNIPLPEVRRIYRHFIDLGVDLVVGHHPHIIQGAEHYNQGIIYYSLGNFAFDSHSSTEGLVLEIDIDKNGIHDKAHQVRYAENQVLIDGDNSKFDELSDLLREEVWNNYEHLADERAIKDYLDFERNYYGLVAGIDFNNPLNIEKFIQHRKNGDPPKWDDVFLYHNIAGEQHRWVSIRAIEALNIL